ncbi:MAG: tetratricopeptide repeat protein [Flavobacteriaceae bacterium]|nr:tetratricopeptide repeat protein [Mangrovimonas sp.]MCB0427570.1 tetratricopeptide repeat protein [Mangrovimonas sp.]MCB0432269.1 tetratricopeptide repeat protein [Mangrovimonas sp.]MCB0439300.1 tetratricopeptide repeat protein [Mangrovimonas sp.]MCB0469755.1 tetratricopeptide repeat protein [Flavobacteriaceae bacterium]
MATYKKRGFKPKTKEEKEHYVEEHSTTAEVFNTLDEKATKTEEWVVKNQKYIFSVIGIIALVVLGYLGYNEFVQKPKQTEAMNEMFQAKKYFNDALTGTEKDSLFNLALNGGEGKYGMIDIAKEYGNTKAGNLAKYYAGMSYLHMRDYEKAVSYLSDFSSDEDILSTSAKGAIGDAFAQLNQMDDALDYYKQAANMSDNEFTAPTYLYKAGTVALELGKAKEALELFNKIKEKYASSTEATNIDVLIGKAEVMASK